MNNGWKEYKLGAVARLSKDTYLPKKNDHLPYIGLEHIQEQGLRLISIGDSDSITSQKYHFKEKDILFGKLRPYFRKVIKPNFAGICSTDIWVVRALENYDQDYLFYFFANQEFVDTANSGDSGTRMPRADWNYVKNTIWQFPPLPEQRAIAGVLSSLDDKIDLLHRQNKTLEGMAEALWRKMFVVDAEPDWAKGKLGDIALINPLRSIKKGASATYIDMSNMPTSGPFPKDWIKREFTSGIKFKNGDTIIARITPCLENGKTAYINFLNSDEVAWGSTEYIVMAPKAGYCAEWVYSLARSNDFRDFAIQNMTGTSGRQRVSGDSIAQYEIAIPPTNYFEKFRTFAEPIMEHIKKNSFQIRTLSRLREALLPKLMSGEVRVKM